jgi:hypothetical protein
MSDVAAALQELAEPSRRGDRVKRAIARAAHLSGLSYWRTYDLWYRKARRVRDQEIAAITQALDKKSAGDVRHELSELRLSLEKLEARVSRADASFNRPTIDLVKQKMP